MFFQSSVSHTCVLLLLKIAHVCCEESTLEVDAPTDVPRIQTSALNVSRNGANDSNTIEGKFPPDVHSANGISGGGVNRTKLPKLRRNGFGDSLDIGDDLKRYFQVPDVLPQHHFLDGGFENDLHYHQLPQQQQHHHHHHHDGEKNRYYDAVYPVRVQNCGLYLRDVHRLQNEASTSHTNRGIVPGWIGGKSRWRDQNGDVDDKRQESSSTPAHIPVTTATAKLPPSHNRYQENSNAERNYNYYTSSKPTHIPVKSRLSVSEYRPEDSSRPYYASERHRDYSKYNNDERNSPPWTLHAHPDRQNRIIYYEYNLEDLRRPKPDDPSSFYSRDYGRRPNNCGYSDGDFITCDQSELHSGSRPSVRLPYDPSYSGPYALTAQSQSWSDQEDSKGEFSRDLPFQGEKHYRLRPADQSRRPTSIHEDTTNAYVQEWPRYVHGHHTIPGSQLSAVSLSSRKFIR